MGGTRKIITIKANADNHGDNDEDDDDDDNNDDDDEDDNDDDTEVEDFALIVEKSQCVDRASPILLSFEFENVDGDPGGL